MADNVLLTAAISVGTSIVTTLATFWLTTKLKKRLDAKDSKDEEIASRLDPHVNVRREPPPKGAGKQIWLINPYWAIIKGEHTRVLGWPKHFIEMNYNAAQSPTGYQIKDGPLTYTAVIDAQGRKEWLRCLEVEGGKLKFIGTEPVSSQDAYLFQEVPGEPPDMDYALRDS